MRSQAIAEPDMVRLEGASYFMGSTAGQEDEAPPHHVVLSPFYIARFAVTCREYGSYLLLTGAQPPPSWNDPNLNQPDQPVVAISWYDAFAYCAWLSSMLQKRFRLPSEAEREYSCRGGTLTAYPWGDEPERACGEYGRRWAEGGPDSMGGLPNAFGLYNMSDNVHEWCSDWYSKDYYRVSPEKDPPGPQSGVRKVARGGSWRHRIKVTRSSARSSLIPTFQYTDFGFRVAGSF